MNKKGMMIGVIVVAIIARFADSVSSSPSEIMNFDMGRTHGTISTTMGSPIFGNTVAPITIVEFSDYQCEKCYEWFHQTKPTITRDYFETGKVNLVFVDLEFLGKDSLTSAQPFSVFK